MKLKRINFSKNSKLLTCFFLSALLYSGAALSERVELVYGAGPSTPIVTLFFQEFVKRPEAAGVVFEVPQRSTKHAGGIRASGEYLFGRTGRPLTPAEKAQGKFEIYLGRVEVGFATAPSLNMPPLTRSDVGRIFSGQLSNWNELGGPNAPIVLVGRERSEAVLMSLLQDFPELGQADYQQIFKRDHAVVNFLKSPAGQYAIGFGALSNFDDLNIVQVAGARIGIKLGLVVDEKHADHPLVKGALRFSRSGVWQSIVQDAGYVPLQEAGTVIVR